ncbi:probable disease resistance protein At4g27220 isoform X4 [Citrus sinensis]|uniref:probable disease resistance protein At4g27220 isoform X3 n=1 Tax=Citrus sinensis TaxID=2711 RepID=UPI002278D4DA|nr:probable disease resistance protein At4g27220 isoform X3 [Citrus sinensis]XP_052298841.1 probable disease resistance protein At4g27220 isoform X4 [Citrus sinensis]
MDIATSAVAKVAEYLVDPIIHPFTYCCTYNTNFEKLNEEVDKLKNARESVRYKVDDSRIKGDGIQQHVEEWLIAANKEINEVETLIEGKENSNNRCLKGLCPNLRTRYQLSKKAEREANAIVGLHEKGRFDSVSFRTIPEETWLRSTQDFMHFESRKSTLKEILDALTNRNFNMIGVYGMGGIGKTTLVKEVGRQAKENNLFEKVISSRVSQTPQIKEIQREIAEKLGLKIDEESETVRAGRLLERLKRETKILIILDDIWGSLDLEAIGIPLEDDNGGCKVLLTARSHDVLSCKMDCQHNFFVDVLKEKEAWSLFKKMTGDCIENGELKSVATEIVKECAGLPIAIVPVARALRNKRLSEWKDALLEFRRPSLRNFTGTTEVAYNSIELSYNHLNGEELKSTFLLIRYAFISCVDDVFFYGMGLGLFQNINTLEEARDRAHTLVEKLKKSCLLLDDNTSEWFSMHDVVRDVAISIASRDQHVFAVENEVVSQINWPDKERLKVCTAISLRRCNISELPQDFECPQLKYLTIDNVPSLRIPDNLFTGMTGLRVLDFTKMHLLPLPPSLGLLQNLQTLSLDDCQLGDIAIIGDLKKLEILTLRGSNMQKLVEEIGRLTQLRLLDLTNCSKLKVIPANVISSLSRLEELYIGESLIEWGKVEGVDGERRNASLDELNNLSKLTSLEILIQDEKTLPRDLSFFKMLQRYRILIGVWPRRYRPSEGISRIFSLSLTNGANICLNEGHIMQLKGIEDLSLDGLPDIKNILCELGREVFPKLKRLQIRCNGNIVRLVDTMDCTPARTTAFPLLESLFLRDLRNLEEICRGPLTAESFCKLKTIRVEGCDKLKNVFPLVIGRGLQQLQSIEVSSCQNMEVIFAAERGDESSKFPLLESLFLTDLRNLEEICRGPLTAESFCKLKAIRVEGCDKLKNVFPLVIGRGLQQLQSIEVSSCQNMEVIFAAERGDESSNNNGTEVIELTQLRKLELRSLPQLTSFCTGDLHIEKAVPNLEDLIVDENHIGLFPEDLLCKLKCLDVGLDESAAIVSLDDFLHRFHAIKVLVIKENDDFWKDPPDEFENGMKVVITGINQRRDLHFEKVFPNLEELRVDEKHICLFPEDWLCKFKCLDVWLDESSTILSLDDFLQRFHTIKILSIGGNNQALYTSFKNVENGMNAIVRGINHRRDLKQIFKQESTNTNDLEKLEIFECDNLINLVPSSISFQNLTTLTVGLCHGMINVLTSSTARSLVRLRQMRISCCEMITEIVADEDDQGDNYAAKDEIVFSELKELELWDLESLTSFICSGNNCAFEFPSLETLLVDRCPNMKIFSEGELSTPKLQKVQLSVFDNKLWAWDRDLNTTIQYVYLKRKKEEKEKENKKSAEANEKEKDAKDSESPNL